MMTAMVWELFVLGLLVYGFVLLAVAAIGARADTRRLEIPDDADAPILVTRRSSRATSTR